MKRYIAKALRQLAEARKESQHETRRQWRAGTQESRARLGLRMRRFRGDVIPRSPR